MKVAMRCASVVAVAAVAVMSATPAMADRDELEGFWYYEYFDIADIHASGVTGEGVTIAVIDSPLYPDLPTLQGANIEIMDSLCYDSEGQRRPSTTTDVGLGSHGTRVVSMIVGTGEGYPGQQGVKGVAPDAHILYYPDYLGEGDEVDCYGFHRHPEHSPFYSEFRPDPDGQELFRSAVIAFSMIDAVDRGADIISVSSGDPIASEIDAAVRYAFHHGVIVVGALNNRSSENWLANLDGSPATSVGALAVIAADVNGNLITSYNGNPVHSTDVHVVGPGVNIVAQGWADGGWQAQALSSGTSYAAPIIAGYLALAMDKYPDAHPWQILQALVHNTGPDGNPNLEWYEGTGYGFVIPAVFLAANPHDYPALNPLLSTDNDVTMRQLCWGTSYEEYEAMVEAMEKGAGDEDGPYCQDFANPTPPEPSPEPTPTPEATDEPQAATPQATPDSAISTWLIIATIAILIIVATAITLTITLTKKPKGASNG